MISSIKNVVHVAIEDNKELNKDNDIIIFNVPLFDSPNLDIGKNNAATT